MKAKAKELKQKVQKQEMEMLQQKLEDQIYEKIIQKLNEKMKEERKQIMEEYEMTQSYVKVHYITRTEKTVERKEHEQRTLLEEGFRKKADPRNKVHQLKIKKEAEKQQNWNDSIFEILRKAFITAVLEIIDEVLLLFSKRIKKEMLEFMRQLN